MARVIASVTIDKTPADVWAAVEDISTHVNWMHDAVAIRFVSDQRSGVGTLFDCDTKVGPFKLVDRMEITEWVPRQTMGVRHVGLVTGTGAFHLRARGGAQTEFLWDEELTFPWWMGGPIGGWVGAVVLKLIWARNLRGLKRQIEQGDYSGSA
jgi:Polyketide cyclase / dehydrase and lipid transport